MVYETYTGVLLMATYPQIPTQGQWTGQTMQAPTGSPVGVLPQASMLYQTGGPQPYPFFTQSYFTPLQEQGYATTLQGLQHGVGQALQNQALGQSLQQGFNQYLGQAGQQASPGFINTIGGSFDPWRNPALDDAVQRANQALVRDYQQVTRPGITGDAIGAGQMGSSRHGVREALAEDALQRNLANQSAQMYNTGYESGMNRYVQDRSNTLNSWLGANRNALSGWQTAPGIASMAMGANLGASNALQNLGAGQAQVGGYYQGLMNQYMGQQRDLWNQYQNRPFDNLNWYANMVYGAPGGTNSTTQNTAGDTPMLPNLLGGAALGYGLWNQFGGSFGGSGNVAPSSAFTIGQPLGGSNPFNLSGLGY